MKRIFFSSICWLLIIFILWYLYWRFSEFSVSRKCLQKQVEQRKTKKNLQNGLGWNFFSGWFFQYFVVLWFFILWPSKAKTQRFQGRSTSETSTLSISLKNQAFLVFPKRFYRNSPLLKRKQIFLSVVFIKSCRRREHSKFWGFLKNPSTQGISLSLFSFVGIRNNVFIWPVDSFWKASLSFWIFSCLFVDN